MVAKAPHEGGQGSCLTGGFHHQDHWQIEQLGDGGRTAFAAGAPAIEQTHHPLHQDPIGLAAMPAVAAANPVFATKQGIKIPALAPRHLGEQLGIQIVGSHFERLKLDAAGAGGGGEAEA
jgi:hypothetical protein